jgi:glyoxylase-like metal-dependent hydrolase (beta-lactamase superfamily II)
MTRRLVDDIYMVEGTFGSNVYILGGNGLALVDAGFPIDLPRIYSGLRDLGARARDLELVIATHYHGDHVGPVAGLRRRHGVRAAIHEEDAPFATGERPIERFEVETSRLIFYMALWPLFRYRCFPVDVYLEEGEELDLADGLTVLHTPGHSRGSICLYQSRRGILFSGDLLRNEKGVLEGPPPQFTPAPEAAAASLERLLELDFEVLLPGHGEPVLEGASKRFKVALKRGEIWPLNRG